MSNGHTENAQTARALDFAADEFGKHEGAVTVGGIVIDDARAHADANRRMAAMLRAADTGANAEQMRELSRSMKREQGR